MATEGACPAFPYGLPYRYEWLEEEAQEDYRPGGYHRIDRGDLLKDGRYKIFHKWGTGTDATIWVARDKLEKWVTIKVKTAQRSKYSRELQILVDLQRHSSGCEPEYFVPILDYFTIHGPNGHHQALVFEMLGPPAYDDILGAIETNERLDFDEIFEYSEAMLRNLSYVHGAGHAHRDLSLKSLVYTSKGLSHLAESDLRKMLGDAQWPVYVSGKGVVKEEEASPEEKTAVVENWRGHVIQSATWEGWDVPEDYALKLFGFESIFAVEAGDCLYGQDVGFVIPSSIPLHPNAHHKVDLWAAGMLIHLLIFLESPCQLKDRPLDLWQDCGSLDAPELPWNWLSRGLKLRRDTHPDELLLEQAPQILQPHWEYELREDIHDPKLIPLLDVMGDLLRDDPNLRLSAEKALAVIQANGRGQIRRSKL